MTVSARGLFSATGNVAKEEIARADDDFYPTPAEPVRAILKAESARLFDFPVLWESAAGDGAISREIERAGHSVFSSDLVDRGCGAEIRDFFSYDIAPAPAILTNPPFCEVNWRDGKGRWVYHAMETLGVEYMALLLSWSWPGAGGLGEVWGKYPPARVYLMRWKIDFTNQGAPPMLNGWFVWDRKWQGETVLRMLDRVDANQGELFA